MRLGPLLVAGAVLLAAIASLPAARRVPALRPLAVALWCLLAIEVARLWTLGPRLDVVLYLLAPGLQVVGAVGVVRRLRVEGVHAHVDGVQRELGAERVDRGPSLLGGGALGRRPAVDGAEPSGVRGIHRLLGVQERVADAGPHAAILALFIAYALLTARFGYHLRAVWPLPLALPYFVAVLAVPWELARARDRGWVLAAALWLPASNTADAVSWLALRALPAGEHPYDVARAIAIVTYVGLAVVLWRVNRRRL